ncbi:unnamed protein product [Nezara viridula]|uniref:Uncharacterized protein n=1 Tax=Nezara viridula TaxID=85310 RepID=A0A9P0MIY1_NEZVI|nr:unnamed protein product [Nezara viridula]
MEVKLVINWFDLLQSTSLEISRLDEWKQRFRNRFDVSSFYLANTFYNAMFYCYNTMF